MRHLQTTYHDIYTAATAMSQYLYMLVIAVHSLLLYLIVRVERFFKSIDTRQHENLYNKVSLAYANQYNKILIKSSALNNGTIPLPRMKNRPYPILYGGHTDHSDDLLEFITNEPNCNQFQRWPEPHSHDRKWRTGSIIYRI